MFYVEYFSRKFLELHHVDSLEVRYQPCHTAGAFVDTGTVYERNHDMTDSSLTTASADPHMEGLATSPEGERYCTA